MSNLPVYDVAVSMRRILVGLVLVLLLAVSIGIGVAASRWPTLLRCWHGGRWA
ncbi:MAG TPA: hypothetical protein VFB37_01780 [Steroidobacteraceae bacterium]|nr:hypothetical protein [Steroidobacteraceae bacterium]